MFVCCTSLITKAICFKAKYKENKKIITTSWFFVFDGKTTGWSNNRISVFHVSMKLNMRRQKQSWFMTENEEGHSGFGLHHILLLWFAQVTWTLMSLEILYNILYNNNNWITPMTRNAYLKVLGLTITFFFFLDLPDFSWTMAESLRYIFLSFI